MKGRNEESKPQTTVNYCGHIINYARKLWVGWNVVFETNILGVFLFMSLDTFFFNCLISVLNIIFNLYCNYVVFSTAGSINSFLFFFSTRWQTPGRSGVHTLARQTLKINWKGVLPRSGKVNWHKKKKYNFNVLQQRDTHHTSWMSCLLTTGVNRTNCALIRIQEEKKYFACHSYSASAHFPFVWNKTSLCVSGIGLKKKTQDLDLTAIPLNLIQSDCWVTNQFRSRLREGFNPCWGNVLHA